MSSAELTLNFSGNSEVSVAYDNTDSGSLPFESPVTDKDRDDIRWYVETYGSASLADPDDKEAQRIKARLPEIGKALFTAVFQERGGNRGAQRIFDRFQDAESEHRVLTIDSADASVLSLPWELMRDPSGTFLFREDPHVSIRRKITGAGNGREPFRVEPKDRLHLLFVVSRPTDAGFIDPRADPQAVLDALEKHAGDRVTYEFLRPATLNALVERLDDDTRPAVDILHFDGHGVFMQVTEDEAEKHPNLYGKTIHSVLHRERQSRGDEASGKPVGIGFLVFEKSDRTKHLISAEDLSDNLFRSKIRLVVLSACQTAALDQDGDPMASVAGKLTSTGIPAIMAMTHSVLVATTRILFGEFYKSLARGRSIATALDDARIFLANNPDRYEVQRGGKRKMLQLDDWFLPALFHGGADSPLLTTRTANIPTRERDAPVKHNLRDRHEAGFFGRRVELWDIACWFGTGETRRISITGFGGQGKTELAMETGRWLLRTRMFRRAVFVDYAAVQSQDALAVAVSTISTVLEETLPDADSVTRTLAGTPTLIILDSLETVSDEALRELLTAAKQWSDAGGSRVLLTSRVPDAGHPDHAVQATRKHRRIQLKGLGSARYPDDALEWFGQLSLLPSAEPPQVPPPKRQELIDLFDRIQFHPLSICVLVQQLKTRTAKQLEQRLEQLLADDAGSLIADRGTPKSLIASLQLSLERLSAEERHAVRSLGVFQGGAFEDSLLAVTGLGGSGPKRKQLQAMLSALEGDDPRLIRRMTGVDANEGGDALGESLVSLNSNSKPRQYADRLRGQLARLRQQSGDNLWSGLRRSLETSALIEVDNVAGVTPPFLRFHPTLAPILWAGLEVEERDALTLAHRRRFYALAGYLAHCDRENPIQARAIIRRELPNLLSAVDQSLKAGDVSAGEFVNFVRKFLTYFGMTREADSLTQRAAQATTEAGSRDWYLAQTNRGEQLLDSGRVTESAEVFSRILRSFRGEPSNEVAATLGRLGQSYASAGRPDLAEATYRQGIAVTERLKPGDPVKQTCGALRTGLADVLTVQGQFADAREQYELGLEIVEELNDLRSQAVAKGQLGSLALREGNLRDAMNRYSEALELFQRLDEPASEAAVHHQLGMAFTEAQMWDQAEQQYREAARLKQQLGDLAGVAQTWSNLGIVSSSGGRPEAAEAWFLKAIEAFQAAGDATSPSKCLNNLANLLRTQQGRLADARQLAEEALNLKLTLDAGASEIWTTYDILAEIADQQCEPEQASEFRQLARKAKRNFAGTVHEMKQHAELTAAVAAVCGGSNDLRELVAAHLEAMRKGGGAWRNGADVIGRVLAGERDAESLCESLAADGSMIVETILKALEE